MKTFDHFFEDIAARQALLKQRQKDQAVAYKKKAAVATSASLSDLTQRSADARKRANSALEAAAQRRKSIAAARAEAEAKKQEREDISKEIADKYRQDRADEKKKNDKKRMGKDRVQRDAMK